MPYCFFAVEQLHGLPADSIFGPDDGPAQCLVGFNNQMENRQDQRNQ